MKNAQPYLQNENLQHNTRKIVLWT